MTQTQNKATLAAALKARQDVDDDDIPEIIGIAQELQSQAADEDDDLSVEEVEDVARELGIDPKYVEEAIAEKERRALAGKAADAKASRLRKRVIQAVAGVIAAVMLATAGLGVIGAGAVKSAASQVELAESSLMTVLERQASLAPQLLALGGGDASALSEASAAVRDAPDLDARLRASEALGVAMAEELSQLPPTEEVVRMNLQYEITGAQNRISTESRRYRAAQAEHAQRAGTMPGRTAVMLGLAPAP
ncbi:MAG: hypothetical protein GY898_05745 [Proteobacteria bacterium]|nr:hypothetical protein [Pseudomonadota bacterium]